MDMGPKGHQPDKGFFWDDLVGMDGASADGKRQESPVNSPLIPGHPAPVLPSLQDASVPTSLLIHPLPPSAQPTSKQVRGSSTWRPWVMEAFAALSSSSATQVSRTNTYTGGWGATERWMVYSTVP